MSGRSSVGGGDLGQLAVLGRELGGGRDLDAVGLPQAALGEGREPAQRLDLDVEQVDADGALLGRRVDVEQAAADRELAAVLDLVDALVAGGDELLGGLVEVDQVADAQHEAVRAQLRVRDLLATARWREITTTGCSEPSGVSVSASSAADAQADEVRRRREVGLVGDAAARVVADGPRAPARRAGRRRGRARRGRRRRRSAPGGGRPGRRARRRRTGAATGRRTRSRPRRPAWPRAGSCSRWLEEGAGAARSESTTSRASRFSRT